MLRRFKKEKKNANIDPQFCVLCIQCQTMQMMHEFVAKELKSMQLADVHPQEKDVLLFRIKLMF